MQNFLIVDDNKEQSETVQSHIQYELEKLHAIDFGVICIFPFEKVEEYFDFMNDSNICVLIVDEKLNDQSNEQGETVDYLGHNLVTVIRERNKDLPIYTITNYSDDSDVQGALSEYDQIISRKNFYNTPEKYVAVMFRAASKFVDRYTNILSELTKLSQEIASGDNSSEKRERIKALQTALELPLLGFDDRLNWLNEYEQQLSELKILREELIKRIGK